MVRRLVGLVVVVVAASVLVAVPVAGQEADASGSGASTVRIQARLVASGRVEFGLQLDGERTWLPRARLFPYETAEVGRWLFASPYTLSDGTVVRIQARLVASGRVEFGLQLDGERTWLPRARLFPYETAEVGRWLFASPYSVVPPTEAVPLDATPDDDAAVDDTGGIHKPAIDALVGEGLFEGTLCGAGRFCPDEPVARSTAAVWLARALGEDPPAVSASRFADVDAELWWARFVERLAALDVATGCEGDPRRYCPDAVVTRGRLATMLVRAFDLEAAPSAAYSDTAGNAHEADIDAVAAAGIAAGCETAPLRFCPDDVVTRGELATLLARALGLVPLAVEFSWTLPSHCYRYPPADPHAPPEYGCPVWWSHLLDLEPSEEGITVAEMQASLAAVLPNYVPRYSDRVDRLSGSAREVITATLTRLAAEDPPTLARLRTVSAKPDVCPGAGACALRYGINFETAHGAERWMSTVQTVVHEWMHLRDFGTAPGTGYSLLWCDRIAERLRVAESTGRLVTHMGLLEAASAAHHAPLVSGPGCADALIARFAPEVRSHDRPRKILELSANAQTQVWMRRSYASAEARWFAAEAAAGFPDETRPLEPPLPRGPLPEPPAGPTEPGDCNDGMHDHPYREGARHYHRGGLDPHTHHRWHVLVDGVAVPAGLASSESGYCEYPDGKRIIGAYSPGTSAGEVISFVSYTIYSPDGKWYAVRSPNCVSVRTPGHPRHDLSSASGSVLRQQVCDDEVEHVWYNCGSRGASTRCPSEDTFADGEYDGDWIACGERGPHGYYREICRATTAQ